MSLLLSNAAARDRFVTSPTAGVRSKVPFIQTIELFEAEDLIASARWFTTATDGVVQLLDIHVSPKHQRQGAGTRLFKRMQREADTFLQTRGQRLRRVFVNAEQKTNITARAFLTGLGFHHVQTISNTLRDEDILVYLLGCD